MSIYNNLYIYIDILDNNNSISMKNPFAYGSDTELLVKCTYSRKKLTI